MAYSGSVNSANGIPIRLGKFTADLPNIRPFSYDPLEFLPITSQYTLQFPGNISNADHHFLLAPLMERVPTRPLLEYLEHWLNILDQGFFWGTLYEKVSIELIGLDDHRYNINAWGETNTNYDAGTITIYIMRIPNELMTGVDRMQKYIGVLCHEITHAFIRLHTPRQMLGEYRTQHPMVIGVTGHGALWLDLAFNIQFILRSVCVWWKIDLGITLSIQFEELKSNWRFSIENLARWGLTEVREHRYI
jgi:hypothetical protein